MPSSPPWRAPTPTASADPLLPLLAVLVGGRGRRMGGVPKGRLPAPGGSGRSIVQVQLELAAALPTCAVLVGRSDAYVGEAPGVVRLADATSGRGGPLAGVLAAWRFARERAFPGVWSLGCDQVGLEARDLTALWRWMRRSGAPAVAFRWGGMRQPLPSLWSVQALVEPVLQRELSRGRGSLRRALEEVGCLWIPHERGGIEDWDTPEDAARGLGRERASEAIASLRVAVVGTSRETSDRFR